MFELLNLYAISAVVEAATELTATELTAKSAALSITALTEATALTVAATLKR